MILITHDLGVVAGMADSIIVMYAGKVFERASAIRSFERPGEPVYERPADVGAGSYFGKYARGELYQIRDCRRIPRTCHRDVRLLPRCDKVSDICRREFPPMVQVAPGHESLCHFAKEVYGEAAHLHS